MREIYLVRHGFPDFPDNKIVVQGRHTDLPLNPLCFKDASNLKDFFSDKKIDNWYCSPLLRARQTLMQFAPQKANVSVLDNAVEVCFGRWEGKSWDENRLADPQLFSLRDKDNTVLPNDGEDMRSAAQRMFSAVKQTSGNCVIASHWTVISLLYCLLNNYPFEQYMEVPHPYLGVSKIIEENGVCKFEYVGKKVCDTPFCDSIK